MSRARMEVPRLGKPIILTPEQKDFLRRRTEPFIDSLGIHRPLSLLLEEVYLQGMTDAIAAMTKEVETRP